MTSEVHVVSHTHWDREWYLTFEEYRLRLVDLVDRVLERMDADARFRHFHLDGQTIVLEDYLEVRPEQESRVRARIAEGRLLVGPWYVMPDMHLVSGEALVRNLTLGHRIAESFGGVMKAGYTPDPFGHVAQMPQILRGFGLADAILWRGFGGERAEYRWEGLDGSSVLLLHLPREGYCNAMRLPLLSAADRERAARELIEREAARSAGGAVLLMAGVDHVEPHPALLDMIDALKAGGATIRLSTLPEYAAAAAKSVAGRDLETIRGELRGGEDYAPLLPGVLSARSYLKQANARVQNLLERQAEPAAAFAWRLGQRHPTGELRYAWRTLLQNHPHDSICGCSVDAVHSENETRFARAQQAAAGVEDRALEYLANAVAPAPDGAARAVIVNGDAHAFAGVLEAAVEIPFALDEVGRSFDAAGFERPLALFPKDYSVRQMTNAQGEPLPFQVLGEEEVLVHYMSRYEPPLGVRARRLHLAFPASLPAASLQILDLHLGAGATRSISPMARVRVGADSIENEHLKVRVRPDGTLSVRDKRTRRELENVLDLQDSSDVGDEYNYDPPQDDLLIASRHSEDVVVHVEQSGPLVGVLRVEGVLPSAGMPPAEDAAADEEEPEDPELPFTIRVSLAAGSSRVEIDLGVTNLAENHRLRVLFPTGAEQVQTSRADAAFGVVTRPARRAVPADWRVEVPVSSAPLQSFVDAGDATSGMSVFSEGLMEYEVTAGARPQIALTLLRAVGRLSGDDLGTRRGHAGPGMATPGAQCLGEAVFRFAFAPRGAPPSEADLYKEARAFLAPPRLFGPAGREGRVASQHSFLDIVSEPPGAAVLSALKRADDRDSLIVRVFNSGDDPARVTLGGLREAHRTDLREQRGEPLAVDGGRATLALGPRRIETLELVFAAP